eukprot:scaffold8637_cov92-Cyclotella_meneghiniana.AAC.8
MTFIVLSTPCRPPAENGHRYALKRISTLPIKCNVTFVPSNVCQQQSSIAVDDIIEKFTHQVDIYPCGSDRDNIIDLKGLFITYGKLFGLTNCHAVDYEYNTMFPAESLPIMKFEFNDLNKQANLEDFAIGRVEVDFSKAIDVYRSYTPHHREMLRLTEERKEADSWIQHYVVKKAVEECQHRHPSKVSFAGKIFISLCAVVICLGLVLPYVLKLFHSPLDTDGADDGIADTDGLALTLEPLERAAETEGPLDTDGADDGIADTDGLALTLGPLEGAAGDRNLKTRRRRKIHVKKKFTTPPKQTTPPPKRKTPSITFNEHTAEKKMRLALGVSSPLIHSSQPQRNEAITPSLINTKANHDIDNQMIHRDQDDDDDDVAPRTLFSFDHSESLAIIEKDTALLSPLRRSDNAGVKTSPSATHGLLISPEQKELIKQNTTEFERLGLDRKDALYKAIECVQKEREYVQKERHHCDQMNVHHLKKMGELMQQMRYMKWNASVLFINVSVAIAVKSYFTNDNALSFIFSTFCLPSDADSWIVNLMHSMAWVEYILGWSLDEPITNWGYNLGREYDSINSDGTTHEQKWEAEGTM